MQSKQQISVTIDVLYIPALYRNYTFIASEIRPFPFKHILNLNDTAASESHLYKTYIVCNYSVGNKSVSFSCEAVGYWQKEMHISLQSVRTTFTSHNNDPTKYVAVPNQKFVVRLWNN
jgi:hypothetical protein